MREMAGDDREFLDFFADQFWSLRRLGYLLTGDWDQAEELAQEAMAGPSRLGRGSAAMTGRPPMPARCWSTGIGRCCAGRSSRPATP